MTHQTDEEEHDAAEAQTHRRSTPTWVDRSLWGWVVPGGRLYPGAGWGRDAGGCTSGADVRGGSAVAEKFTEPLAHGADDWS